MTPSFDRAFDLTPSEEQQLVIDALTRFAQEQLRPQAQKADLEQQLPESYLAQVAALGLPLANLPESIGGNGARSPISNALVAETLAYGDMAMAIAALSPVSFANALMDQASPSECEHWLKALTSSDFVAASLALIEPKATSDPLKPATQAVRKGEDWVLDGTKSAIPLGAQAQYLLVSATDSDTGVVRAFVVEGGTKGLGIEQERWMGLCALGMSNLKLDSVRVPRQAEIGAENGVDLARILALGRIGIAAATVGVCQGILDYCIPYCNERQAFGEPISNRQAVAFKLADAATETEAMRLLVWRAAGAAENHSEASEITRLAALAHRFSAQKGMQIANDGVQLLGGHGYTREHPVELWYRNLRAVELMPLTIVP
ncbi:MAG: acyl-CoA dehydrogenase family protein [Gammaproteobacteria bacterium]